MYAYGRLNELNELVSAYGLVQRSGIALEDAVAELNDLRMVEAWLSAENAYNCKIELWLRAESRWKLAQTKFDDETYAAAKRAWNLVKSYVPSLDGVSDFESLAPSLQFRYATFAAGVLGLLPPEEVKSKKQHMYAEAAQNRLNKAYSDDTDDFEVWNR